MELFIVKSWLCKKLDFSKKILRLLFYGLDTEPEPELVRSRNRNRKK